MQNAVKPEREGSLLHLLQGQGSYYTRRPQFLLCVQSLCVTKQIFHNLCRHPMWQYHHKGTRIMQMPSYIVASTAVQGAPCLHFTSRHKTGHNTTYLARVASCTSLWCFLSGLCDLRESMLHLHLIIPHPSHQREAGQQMESECVWCVNKCEQGVR